jgi:hypothetical protein
MPNPNRLRCPECRTRRTDPRAMALHVAQCMRPLCTCEGVPFQNGLAHHRKGTRGCTHHPLAGLDRAERHGASPAELADIERRIRAELPGPDCPF